MSNEGVEIEFTGPFRKLSGERKIFLPLEHEVTLNEFIEILSRKFGDEFRKRVLDEAGKLDADRSIIIINGRIVDSTKETSYVVKPGDTVAFALSLAGGG
ncbi:MAG: MoaD/ThiS family protein [Candidatus Brockarchaeota archaeon]|nr:MoaD/ThiS family protein [Candidatus Brockarchaeota archaeon]